MPASITPAGLLNTTALVVPGLYIQIVPPTVALNGVPTNIVGVVGTASYGPVGVPVIVSGQSDYNANFGPIRNRKYDLGTNVVVMAQQGAQNFRAVRVTDGTDAAATAVIATSCLTLTARYTGSAGNSTAYQIVTGSAANSFAILITNPVLGISERFDNIVGTGNAFWLSAQSVVNNGSPTGFQGPSKLVTAAAGAGTTAAAVMTTPTGLSGGLDGTTTITSTVLLGTDGASRVGMYALRGSGASILVLADADDSTTWTNQSAFALSTGMYVVIPTPSGDTISNAVSTKASAGLDTYAAKMMLGDWLYWWDATNAIYRLVSPAAVAAGRLAALSPEQSSLNKPLQNIVGSQKAGVPGTAQLNVYSNTDLQTLFQAGIDVIGNPSPGGNYWSVLGGFNTSSNAAVNDDSYTRMTNYIAATMAGGMGIFVGQVINLSLLRAIRSTLLALFSNMVQQGQLALNIADGSVPYIVTCGPTNNPQARTSLGYVQADVQVTYQGINKKFLINLQGGPTVITTGSISTVD